MNPDLKANLEGSSHSASFETPLRERKGCLKAITVFFCLLALVSLPLCLMMGGMCFDAPGSTRSPVAIGIALAIVSVPFLLAGGQVLVWKGYRTQKRSFYTLGMMISFLPFIAWLALILGVAVVRGIR